MDQLSASSFGSSLPPSPQEEPDLWTTINQSLQLLPDYSFELFGHEDSHDTPSGAIFNDQLNASASLWMPWNDQGLIPEQDEPLELTMYSKESSRQLKSFPAWIPAPGTGALKRNHEQSGGALQEQPIIEAVHVSPVTTLTGDNGLIKKKTVVVQLQHNLHDIEDLLSVASEIDEAFGQIVEPLIAEAEPSDRVAVEVDHPDLDESIRLCFVHKLNFNPQTFLDRIYRWVQSSSHQFLMDGQLSISVTIVKNPHGGSRVRSRGPVQTASGFEGKGTKNSVIDIKSSSDDCGWRAVALGKFLADNPNPRTTARSVWREMCADDSNVLWAEGRRLFGVRTQELAASDFREVQELLPGYQFIVVMKPARRGDIMTMSQPLFKGEYAAKTIVIELDQGHYKVIKSLKAYYGVDNNEFCVHCWRSVSTYHTCAGFCQLCGNQECKADIDEEVCPNCNLSFRNKRCFETHPCCKKQKRCRDCDVVYQANKNHVCGQFVCHYCDEAYTVSPHRCYIKPLDMEKLRAEDSLVQVIVCFDIESRITDSGEHIANLLICQTVCDICAPGLSDKSSECDNCGVFEQLFFGDDCVARFMDYVMVRLSFQVAKNRSKIHVFSHNAKGYDNRFVWREIMKRDYMDVRPVMQGSKILKIDVANVRFQDSMAFLQMPLSRIPESMGYDGVPLKKGHFPHLFNKEENYGIVAGNWPDVAYYDPSSMRGKDKEAFMLWYESVKEKKFNFMDELVSYCRMDVDILMFGVRKFRDLYGSVTSLNPITRSFTLAGMVFENFRAADLKENVIGVTPVDGYLETRKASAEGNAWLDLIVKKTGRNILREQHVGPYWADGLDGKDVFEYLGCYYHGCRKCYRDDDRLSGGRTRNELLADLDKKLSYYDRKGYTVYCTWGCDKELANDAYFQERKRFWSRMKDMDVKGPRDGLCGGRTENFKLMHDCEEDEEIKYVDFVSLYPYVLKHRDYPVGHGRLITEDIRYEPGKYFGSVCATVLPPRDLLIPVLPVHQDDKLLFVLCGKCGMESGDCSHSDTERAITGTFVSVELDLALSKGYELVSCDYVIQFDQRSREIFSPFINRWLKLKLETSGFPDDVVTEEDKYRFVEETFRREGIRLDKDKIRKNPGLRFISKLMLNSLWGRLAMRGNMWQTSIVPRFQEFMEILADEKREVLAPLFLPGEKSMVVNWRYKEEKDARQNSTSPAIASFVTAYGRMKLYELIDQIESVRPGRSLYCDTDSLFFVHKSGDPDIQTGFQLGELTNEEVGKRIVCGLFLAPKSYCYVTRDQNGQEKAVVKVKGITLTDAASKVVNVSAMRDLIVKFMSGEKEVLAVPQLRFSANKRQQVVRSDRIMKRFQVTSNKRRVIGKETVPFGYRRE